MPVYILDNGRSWSDHQIWIVEPTADEESYFSDFLEAFGKVWPRDFKAENGEPHAHLIARVMSADWFASRMSVTDFIYKLEESYHMPARVRDAASAKKARDLAAILVPNIWEFDGGIEFKEIWK